MKSNFLQTWRKYLQRTELNGLVGILLDVIEPFSLFAAQLVWIAQPTLSIFLDREEIAHWAQKLEDPQGIAQLREKWLTDNETDE